MTTRLRLLLMLLLVVLGGGTAAVTGATLVAVVFDGDAWTPPADVLIAVEELRADGYEIRVVDHEVSNGDDQPPAELRPMIEAANKHGLPAIVFQSGGRIAVDDVPPDKDTFLRAVR